MDFFTIELAVDEATTRLAPTLQIIPQGLDENNDVVVAHHSPWGIDVLGIPYYDINGALPGDRAYLSVSQITGGLVLTKLRDVPLEVTGGPGVVIQVLVDTDSYLIGMEITDGAS